MENKEEYKEKYTYLVKAEKSKFEFKKVKEGSNNAKN